jgi:hypothetical protein
MRYFVKVSSGSKNVEFGFFATRDAARTYAKKNRDAGFVVKMVDRVAA